MIRITGKEKPASALMNGIRYVLLDCDGVLWAGDHLLPGVAEALAALRRDHGCEIRFITNNATMSRAQMLQTKFHRLGLSDVRPHEILSSAYAARIALQSLQGQLYSQGNVLVLGNAGLHAELLPALAKGCVTYGLELHRPASRPGMITAFPPYDMKLVARAWDEPLLPRPSLRPLSGGTDNADGISLKDLNIAAVVIGLDFHFTPTTLALACMCLQRHERVPGATPVRFIATNRDPQISIGKLGWLMPGAGSLVASLAYASGREPDIVCGKPETRLFELFLAAEKAAGFNVLPSECLMVGDRLSTDIAFGNAAGARTLFVLCGCETEADIPTRDAIRADPSKASLLPHFVADNLLQAISGGAVTSGSNANKQAKL